MNRLRYWPAGRRFKSVAAATLAMSALVLVAPLQADQLTALVGATVHPISGPAIEQGVVLVGSDGVILGVGNGIEVPSEAQRVDLTGKHLYPGFVHPLTPLGLSEIGSVRGTVDVYEVGDNNSDLRAEAAFNADSLRLPATTAGGITSALIYQRGGLFSGTSAVMRLQGWNWHDMTVKGSAGLHLWFPAIPEDAEGDAEDSADSKKAIQSLNDLMDRAQAYRKASLAKAAGLDHNPKLARLVSLVAGDLKLFVHVRGRHQIEAAMDWLGEQELKDVTLVADYQVRYVAQRVAEAGWSVILNGVHVLPTDASEPYDAAYAAAAELHAKGVTFAIGDGGDEFGSSNARNLPFHAAMAASYGLDPDQALRAVTLDAARVIGVGDRLGSIEPGKEASLMVTNGDPLEAMTSIEQVWVAGRVVSPEANHQHRLYQKYWNRPRPTD